jgi:Leucine-rich repeat (LRR) protein
LDKIKTFPSLPKLKKLRLNYCGINEIDPRAFDQLTAMETLEISGNASLEKLELGRVVPRVLNANGNKRMTSVTIQVYNTRIRLESVDVLIAGKSNITLLDGNARLMSNLMSLRITPTLKMNFGQFSCLVKLDLVFVNLFALSREQFKGLFHLKELKLHSVYKYGL